MALSVGNTSNANKEKRIHGNCLGDSYSILSNSTTSTKNSICGDSSGSVVYITSSFTSSGGSVDYLYKSVNKGSNWSALTNAGQLTWTKVACSSNGSVIYATYYKSGSNIKKSTDGGSSWSTISLGLLNVSINKLACSSDGNMIYLAFYSGTTTLSAGPLYYSEDAGSSWTNSGVASHYYNSLVCPKSGRYAYLTYDGVSGTPTLENRIIKTTNWGASWGTVQYTNNFNVISANAGDSGLDGQNVIGITTGGTVIKSVNEGTSFSPISGAPEGDYYGGFSVSQDGARLLYMGKDSLTTGPMFNSSVDGGNTWVSKYKANGADNISTRAVYVPENNSSFGIISPAYVWSNGTVSNSYPYLYKTNYI